MNKLIKNYSPYNKFDKEEIICHTKFGTGMVLESDDSKISVKFIDTDNNNNIHNRTLVHNRNTSNIEEIK